MCKKPPHRTIYWPCHINGRRINSKPENKRQNRRPPSNSIFNKNRKGKYNIRKKNFRSANFYAMRTELDFQTSERLNVRNNVQRGFEILNNRVNAASRICIPIRRATISYPSWINNDVKQAIDRRQKAYEAKIRFSNDETIAEYEAMKRV